MVPAASEGKTAKKATRPVIAAVRCKGCGFCVEFCPKDVLVISTEFNAKGYFLPKAERPEACIGCGLCEMVCPDFALHMTEATKE